MQHNVTPCFSYSDQKNLSDIFITNCWVKKQIKGYTFKVPLIFCHNLSVFQHLKHNKALSRIRSRTKNVKISGRIMLLICDIEAL